MRIGLDGKILSLRVGGTGRYAINLTREILDEAAASRPDLDFVVFTGPRSDPDVVAELGRLCETHRLTAGSSVIRSLTQVPRRSAAWESTSSTAWTMSGFRSPAATPGTS